MIQYAQKVQGSPVVRGDIFSSVGRCGAVTETSGVGVVSDEGWWGRPGLLTYIVLTTLIATAIVYYFRRRRLVRGWQRVAREGIIM